MVWAMVPVIASTLTGVYQNKGNLRLTFDPPEFTPPPPHPLRHSWSSRASRS